MRNEIHCNLLVLLKICRGVTTSQPHTDQIPTELPGTQSVGSKKVPLHIWFRQVFQKKMAERTSGVLLLIAKHARHAGQVSRSQIQEQHEELLNKCGKNGMLLVGRDGRLQLPCLDVNQQPDRVHLVS